MALTLEQELALLALLSEKKITLSELPAATGLGADDLMLTRQGIIDKSITGEVLKRYVTPDDASLTASGIVKLNNDVNSHDETTAATPKAVKGAYDKAVEAISIANERVSSVNGKEGEVTLTAADVDSVSATNGGTFQKPIAIRYDGPFGFVDQYYCTAPIFNEFINIHPSEYHPLIKQKSENVGHARWSISLGTLIQGANTSFNLYMRNEVGNECHYTFNTNGDFHVPGAVRAGAAGAFVGNGDVYGPVWGGWLSEWVHYNIVRDVRLGAAQWHQVWNSWGIGDEWGFVITAVANNNADAHVDTLCRRPIQIFIAGAWRTIASI